MRTPHLIQRKNLLHPNHHLTPPHQPKQLLHIPAKTLTIPTRPIKRRLPPIPEFEILRKQLHGGRDHGRFRTAGESGEIAAVADEEAGRVEDREGFIPGLEAEGVEDGVDAGEGLHACDPGFVGVGEEGDGGEGGEDGAVVSGGGGAVDGGAAEGAEGCEGPADGAGDAVDEDLLAGEDFGLVFYHAVGCGF